MDETFIDAQRISARILIETMNDKPLHKYTSEGIDAWAKAIGEEREWEATSWANFQ